MAAVAACTVSVAGLLEAVNTVLASGAVNARVTVDGNAHKVTLSGSAGRQFERVGLRRRHHERDHRNALRPPLARLKAALASIPSGVTAALAFFDAAAPAPALWTLTYSSNPQRIATVTNVAK